MYTCVAIKMGTLVLKQRVMDLNIIRCWNYIRQGSVRKDEEHLNWRICDLMEGSYFDKECKL